MPRGPDDGQIVAEYTPRAFRLAPGLIVRYGVAQPCLQRRAFEGR